MLWVLGPFLHIYHPPHGITVLDEMTPPTAGDFLLQFIHSRYPPPPHIPRRLGSSKLTGSISPHRPAVGYLESRTPRVGGFSL